MTVPMIILALGSLVLGGLLLVDGAFQNWLEPSTGAARRGGAGDLGHDPALADASLVVAVGVALAWRMYLAQPVPEVAPRGSIATVAARRDLFQDDVNEAVFMRPGQYLTRSLVFVDIRGIDGAVRGAAAAHRRARRPLAPLADRVRPLLRHVDARGRARRSPSACSSSSSERRNPRPPCRFPG